MSASVKTGTPPDTERVDSFESFHSRRRRRRCRRRRTWRKSPRRACSPDGTSARLGTRPCRRARRRRGHLQSTASNHHHPDARRLDLAEQLPTASLEEVFAAHQRHRSAAAAIRNPAAVRSGEVDSQRAVRRLPLFFDLCCLTNLQKACFTRRLSADFPGASNKQQTVQQSGRLYRSCRRTSRGRLASRSFVRRPRRCWCP